jgi:hypothetical protein
MTEETSFRLGSKGAPDGPCPVEGWKQVEGDSFHPLMPMNRGIAEKSGGVEAVC